EVLLLLSRTDPVHAPKAIERLRAAAEGFGLDYARSHGMNLASLANAYFRAGEAESAVSVGHDAVTAIAALSSRRAHARLRDLAVAAEPHVAMADAAELSKR